MDNPVISLFVSWLKASASAYQHRTFDRPNESRRRSFAPYTIEEDILSDTEVQETEQTLRESESQGLVIAKCDARLGVTDSVDEVQYSTSSAGYAVILGWERSRG